MCQDIISLLGGLGGVSTWSILRVAIAAVIVSGPVGVVIVVAPVRVRVMISGSSLAGTTAVVVSLAVGTTASVVVATRAVAVVVSTLRHDDKTCDRM